MTEQPLDFRDRKFSLHLFWVSHGVLLLQSGLTQEHPSRIDVLFMDVVWLSIPAWLNGLRIEECELSEALPLLPAYLRSEAEDRRVYCLVVDGTRHFVVCGDLRTTEDQAGYFDDSALLPGLSMP